MSLGERELSEAIILGDFPQPAKSLSEMPRLFRSRRRETIRIGVALPSSIWSCERSRRFQEAARRRRLGHGCCVRTRRSFDQTNDE